MQSSNKEAALSLVSRGLHIFPCNPDKTPTVAAWEQSASRSLLRWEAVPNALPAIPVGAHALVVIDCDRKQAGIDGVEAFHALCAEQRIDLSNAFVVETPSKGLHFYWHTDIAFGNSSGSLPNGIDVRGIGGYVIAPGATLPDGRSYRHLAGSWDAIPPLPDALAMFLKVKRPATTPEPSASRTEAVTDRERAYAETALADECATLASMRPGQGRNAALNQASHSIGTMVGAGWIERETVEQALWEAAEQNGYRASDGNREAWKTLQSGLDSGIAKPRDPLPASEVPQWVRETVANLLTAHKVKQSASLPRPNQSVVLLRGSDIQARPIQWLWKGYLPLGKMMLLAGAGGTGKSTVAFNWTSIVTNGWAWPDGTPCCQGNVVIWSSEDDPADTIKPRLMAVGAREDRYFIIGGVQDGEGKGRSFDPAHDLDKLRQTVSSIGGVSLLIVDPIVNAITGDMNKANDVRRSLQSFVDFAGAMNCAVLGITHFTKGSAGKTSGERILGSSAFKDFARTALVTVQDEETGECAFARAKTNIAVNRGGFSYRIEEVLTQDDSIETIRVVWGQVIEGSARSILAKFEGDGKEDGEKMKEAKMFLIEMLGNGPALATELIRHAREEFGIKEDTLRRAYRSIGVTHSPSGFQGRSMWVLPLANPSQSSR
jgi:hypothetical protein